ncbi:MAG: hypothetical protein AMJ54_15605 [Deltaproteobacteria bacterium SG8_13]|nr:MAG: hypothetical protein AMJ54_15605 [Deltaproteobacteria bacterium SG8_13]
MKSIGIYLTLLFLLSVAGCFTAIAAEKTDSMMCDDGLVEIGDFTKDLESKCGTPDSKEGKFWRYAFGPSEKYMVEFDDSGNVVRILEEH